MADEQKILLLSNLFQELKKLEQDGDFEKALKTSNKSMCSCSRFDFCYLCFTFLSL